MWVIYIDIYIYMGRLDEMGWVGELNELDELVELGKLGEPNELDLD